MIVFLFFLLRLCGVPPVLVSVVITLHELFSPPLACFFSPQLRPLPPRRRPPPPPPPPPSLAAYTFILDDLVFDDGSTRMGVIGGSGPQTAWGVAAAALLLGLPPQRTSVCARVGPDLPPSATAWLAALVADTTTLLPRPDGGPTPRAWQLVDGDGRRVQVWRTPFTPALADALLPPVASLPSTVLAAAAHHVGVDPLNPAHAGSWLAALRATAVPGARISAETFAPAPRRPSTAELAAVLQHVDRFSPNVEEAASLVGADGGAAGALARLAAAGAPSVAVRCGADGALFLQQRGQPVYTAPAVTHASVVDTTGAGNAMLGALLAADASQASPQEALAVATAVASLITECLGVPDNPVLEGRALEVARERVAWVRGRVRVSE